MSPILAPGVEIVSASLSLWTNDATPTPASGQFTIGPVEIAGKAAYARVSGGAAGQDYQFRFLIQDSDGNTWPRTVLGLCAATS
jgi:hypothetical protein